MKRQQWLILLLVNFYIAVGFFMENRGTSFTQLSSDLHNSIPVCYKLDNPSLYQHDLYLYDAANIKYYTPFYIETVRFFAGCFDGDYLTGISFFASLLHLVYGFSWFFLFHKIFRRFDVALLLSVLIRGIVWLPGLEIWGISDIWTMMPRTMYAAFLPLPFLLLFVQTRVSFCLSAFVAGFIFNFHPITGMGGLWLYIAVAFIYCRQHNLRPGYKTIAIAFSLLLLGMLPFVSTYFLQGSKEVYDITLYKAAFAQRIPAFFTQPLAYLKLWATPKMLFFFLPLLGYYAYARFADKSQLKNAVLLLLASLSTIVVFLSSTYVEAAANNLLGIHLNMAFQIIRAQKLAVLPGYVALGFLIKIALERNASLSRMSRFTLPLFIVMLVFSKEAIFKNVPFFRDDIATSIFPDYRQFWASAKEKETPLDRMLAYVEKNTPADAVFYGRPILRCAAKRAVVLDNKGATMLIESNPAGLIKWYQETKAFNSVPEKDKVSFLKNEKQVTHILSDDDVRGNVVLLHTEGKIKLYQIQ